MKIQVIPDGERFRASVPDAPLWMFGTGRTPREAIGDLVACFPASLSITVHLVECDMLCRRPPVAEAACAVTGEGDIDDRQL
jgi:hypothetical protein